MLPIRRRLSWLVAGWLTAQLAVLAGAPVALQAMSATAASAAEAACDCPGSTPRQQCPMHRQHGTDHHQQEARCAMRSAVNQFNATLLVLATPGVVPQSRFVPQVPQSVDSLFAPQRVTASRAELPEFPPPRA